MYWDDGWHHNGQPGWWLFMAFMMIVFWGAIAWVVVTAIRHSGGGHRAMHSHGPGAPSSPEDVLHERLARGDVTPDEYRERLAALREGRAGAP